MGGVAVWVGYDTLDLVSIEGGGVLINRGLEVDRNVLPLKLGHNYVHSMFCIFFFFFALLNKICKI